MQPPAFCSGSRITAATVSGPSNSIRSLDRARPPRAGRGPSGQWYALVFGSVDAARHRRLERDLEVGQAGRRERPHRGAVVGDLAGDDLRALAAAVGAVPVARDLDRGLDRLRAAVGEEDAVEVARGELGDPLGELDRARMRVAPVRVEVELADLGGGRLAVVGAAVAGVAAEERAEAVEVAVAVVVVDVGALAAGDDRDLVVGVVAAHSREVQPEVACARSPAGRCPRLALEGCTSCGVVIAMRPSPSVRLDALHNRRGSDWLQATEISFKSRACSLYGLDNRRRTIWDIRGLQTSTDRTIVGGGSCAGWRNRVTKEEITEARPRRVPAAVPKASVTLRVGHEALRRLHRRRRRSTSRSARASSSPCSARAAAARRRRCG